MNNFIHIAYICYIIDFDLQTVLATSVFSAKVFQEFLKSKSIAVNKNIYNIFDQNISYVIFEKIAIAFSPNKKYTNVIWFLTKIHLQPNIFLWNF